jgi:Zn-dependent M28 family amino/carboxypeptidase
VQQVEMGPRIPGTPGHDAIVAWLEAELTRMGAQVEEQAFDDTLSTGPLRVRNLRARFPAAGAGARRVVLAAHYDTRPWCDRDPDSTQRNQPLPGANDGGSGVAVLLEIGELLAVRKAPVEVELVFFDAEDQGREGNPDEYSRGARGYAQRVGNDRPAAAFVFDMVGDKDLNIHPESFSSSRAANLVAMTWEGAKAVNATGFRDGIGHAVTDDHLPLLDAGIPAIDIIDFDYAAWHTRADTPDQVSGESLAQVARVAAWLVYDSPLARPGR